MLHLESNLHRECSGPLVELFTPAEREYFSDRQGLLTVLGVFFFSLSRTDTVLLIAVIITKNGAFRIYCMLFKKKIHCHMQSLAVSEREAGRAL